ncbi:MAG: YdcF family protein [Bradyrhizobium sp.]
MAVYFVIFGAAVRADGTPSGSLARRVEGALALARDVRPRLFLATGGVGRYGPAEAQVIRNLLLAAGAQEQEILTEDRATDTLQSVLFCHAILRGRSDVDLLVPCSSGYHNFRCALLFRILGYSVRIGRMPPELAHLGLWRWSRYVVKEIVALPYDAALLLCRRLLNRLP